MTLGPERSTLRTDNATHVLLTDAQHRQNAELVEGVSTQVLNGCHLLRVAVVLHDRPRPPHATLIAAVVVAQLVLHLVVQRDGTVDEPGPRRPHDRHLGRRRTRRLQRRWILQTWYS